jgi:hypothetical protein
MRQLLRESGVNVFSIDREKFNRRISRFASCGDWRQATIFSRGAYVSSGGTDGSGCGAVSAPCRNLQDAHNLTTAGGEVVLMEPGAYGPVTINRSIRMVNDRAGATTMNAASNGNAVTIVTPNAADVVHLRGLEVDGFPDGANGIVFKGQGKLDVVRTTVRRFTGANADGRGVGVMAKGDHFSKRWRN